MTVTVTGRNFYVSLDKVWAKLDPLMPRAEVVGVDESTKWDKLAAQMKALDVALGVELVDVHGEVLGVVGADWLPPLTPDPAKHVEYLERVADHTKEALKTAETMADSEKQRVRERAMKAVETARGLAKKIVDEQHIIYLTDDQKKAAKEVEKNLDDLWDTLMKALGLFGVTVLGVAVGWWVVVGVGAYLYFKEGKRAAA